MTGRFAKPSARFTAIATWFARIRTRRGFCRRGDRRRTERAWELPEPAHPRGAGRSAPETTAVSDDDALDLPQNVLRPLAKRTSKLRRGCANDAHLGSDHVRHDRSHRSALQL